jgi:cell wall-associated NlpC family hydrolase
MMSSLRMWLTVAVALGAAAAPAHAQVFGVKHELPKPFARYAGDSVVARARTELGTRYRLGASAPGRGFDCSGFVKWVMTAFDVKLPRTSREQAQLGVALPRDTAHLKPGDLLTFGSPTRISHVGIYVGGGRYIHASSARRGVTESSLLKDDRRGWWRGARRVLEPAQAAADTAGFTGGR